MNCKVQLISLAIISCVYAEHCKTPNNEVAKCVTLFSCPTLITSLTSNPEFYRKSVCGGDAINPIVCCGSSSTFIQPKPNKHTPETLLPSRKICGLQHSDDFLHSTNGTILTDYPWLARIKHEMGKVTTFRCSGSLISRRYVLTAAWCVTHAGKPVVVRLGEYHIEKKSLCMEYSQYYECNDEFEEFGIEKIMYHPAYQDSFDADNIGLIRLDRKVTYSDYIRPICLPLPETKPADFNERVIMAGWGLTAILGKEGWKREVAKTEVFCTLITNDECEQRIRDRGFPLTQKLGEKRKCVAPVNEDVCAEMYLGTPVMFCRKHQWYQEAMTTEASLFSACTPSVVVTNVSHYIDWIKTNLEP